MAEAITGGCHCGAVRYACTEPALTARLCQCADCRKFSGAGHAAHLRVPAKAFSVSGTPKGYAVTAESGNVVERFFCLNCGVMVYVTNSGVPQFVGIRASTLDHPALYKPVEVIWASSAVPWDYMDPTLPKHPKGAPPAK